MADEDCQATEECFQFKQTPAKNGGGFNFLRRCINFFYSNSAESRSTEISINISVKSRISRIK
ncbi:MAG TPA: hypothetical protein DEH25_08170 [Chloroflexi bacterium]|nr:hypothetical protein [Chloroflexota bacterium]